MKAIEISGWRAEDGKEKGGHRKSSIENRRKLKEGHRKIMMDYKKEKEQVRCSTELEMENEGYSMSSM